MQPVLISELTLLEVGDLLRCSSLDNPVILRGEGERSKKGLLCQVGKVCVEGSELFTLSGANTGHVDTPAGKGQPGGAYHDLGFKTTKLSLLA